MHQSSFHIIARFRELVEKNYPQSGIRILDVGSYGVNGTYKEIFSDTVRYHYTGLDVSAGPNVDYVPADPYNWPELTDESFDVIISGQAFEHIEHPWLIMEEMSRVLKRNGLVCIVAPSRGPEHKYPVDCWRYYPDGFRALAKWVNLQVIDSKTNWGKSGFNDGSDQWGDSFCILYKPENQIKKDKQQKRDAKSLVAFNSNNPLRQSKQISYYGFARPEVIAAVNKNRLPTAKILEIGCAGGATGKALKEKLPVQSYVGIDISEEAAAIAQKHLDRVIVANIEETDLSVEHGLRLNNFDLLLALDVLEHLSNPWDILAELSSYVKPGGFVVASLPNVQNIAIVQDLISGKWQYQDAGILDATHLRFFTLESAKKMFSGAGLNIKGVENVINPSLDIKTLKESGNKYRYANVEIDNLTKQELIDLFTYQYIIIAQKPDSAGNFVASGAENCKLISGNDQINTHFEHDKSENELTSLVILTCNELEYTKKCVKSLRRHTPEPHEVIFVDNGSTDGTLQWLKRLTQENKNYRLISNKKNLGFARGCNQGIEASQGEFVLLLNNDVLVTKDWLSGLVSCLNQSPNAGIVGPMTNNISGPQRVVLEGYRSVDDLDRCAAAFRERYRYRRIAFRRIVGFCMLFRRTLIEQIGMLDESFGTGNFEDDDFCLRAALAGYANYIVGDVFIHHYGSRSFIGNKIDYSTSISGNIKIFEEKWAGLDFRTDTGKKVFARDAIDKAHRFYQTGNIDKAIDALIAGIKHAPEEKGLYYHLAEMLLDAKLYKDALEAVDSLPVDEKDDLPCLEVVARCKYGIGESGDYIERLIMADKNSPVALNLKGMQAYRRGDREAAEDFFEQAIAVDPGYGSPHTNLGILKWASGKDEKALDYFEKGFILSPTATENAELYHSAVTETGQFARAERFLRDAVTLYPESKKILFFLIDLLIKQGEYGIAMDEIEKAMLTVGIDDGMLAAALEIRNRVGVKGIAKPSNSKDTLSLCMIVKNEEQHLARCLLSVKLVVDEMIVVDTGSTDRTSDIAKAFGAKVFDFPWSNDFSAARNHSLSMANGNWILVLDADEIISELDHPTLRNIVKKKNSQPVAYAMVTRNYTNEVATRGWTANDRKYRREEAGTGWFPSKKVRLFPNNKEIRFQNPVHELVEVSVRKIGLEIKHTDIPVHHYGRFDKDKLLMKGKEYFLLGMRKLEEMKGDMKALRELAIQASELKEYETAVDLWKKVIESNPNDAGAYLNISYAYLRLEKYREGLVSSKRATELDPDMKEAALNYADSEFIIGDVGNTISVLEKVLQRDPDYPPAMALLAAALYTTGRREAGLALFEKLRKKGFHCAEFLHLHHQTAVSLGREDQAIMLLQATVDSGFVTEDTLRSLNQRKQTGNGLTADGPVVLGTAVL
jgi:GT2 family glycosyltransferase/2-polyprenyl-3-methyl-5-hydroxy-6-metoxy-1,4-benzoquinol methylase/Tfp pilus assembly protein PilF